MDNQIELQTLGRKNDEPTVAATKLLVENGHKHQQKAKWTKLLALSSIATTMGTIMPAGYAMGVVNSPAEHIRLWANQTLTQRYEVSLSVEALAILWSAIVSIFLVGGAVGSLCGAWTADKFGRLFTLVFSKALLILAAICFLSCRKLNSVELLLLGRLLVGLASGLCMSCLPMYLSEIAPADLRGTLSVFCAMGLCAGIFVGQIFSLSGVFGSARNWHNALGFYVLFTLAALVPYGRLPESPKWLFVVKKDVKHAEDELQRLRHATESALVANELEIMSKEAQESSKAMGFIEVFTEPKYCLPLLLVFVCQFGQQLTGINAIFYYSVSIFQKAGLTTFAAEWANFGAGFLNFAMVLFAPQLMAKYNTRTLLLFSTFWCAISLSTFVIMLYFIESVTWFAMGCVACIFSYIFFFQVGLGIIPYFIASELFEVSPRPVAMSFGSLANFSGNFIVGMTFPSLQNAWGALSFMPFVITCVAVYIPIYFYMPKTKGRSTAQVAHMVSKGLRYKVRN